MAEPTLYDVLGVPPDASADEIRLAHRRQLRYWHPDHNTRPDADARSKAINTAYEVLSNPVRRAEYDRGLAEGGAPPPPPADNAPGWSPPPWTPPPSHGRRRTASGTTPPPPPPRGRGSGGTPSGGRRRSSAPGTSSRSAPPPPPPPPPPRGAAAGGRGPSTAPGTGSRSAPPPPPSGGGVPGWHWTDPGLHSAADWGSAPGSWGHSTARTGGIWGWTPPPPAHPDAVQTAVRRYVRWLAAPLRQPLPRRPFALALAVRAATLCVIGAVVWLAVPLAVEAADAAIAAVMLVGLLIFIGLASSLGGSRRRGRR